LADKTQTKQTLHCINNTRLLFSGWSALEFTIASNRLCIYDV